MQCSRRTVSSHDADNLDAQVGPLPGELYQAMMQTTWMRKSARFPPFFSVDRFERWNYVRTRSARLSQRSRFVRPLVIYRGGVRSPPATGRRCGSRLQIGAGAGGGAAKSACLQCLPAWGFSFFSICFREQSSHPTSSASSPGLTYGRINNTPLLLLPWLHKISRLHRMPCPVRASAVRACQTRYGFMICCNRSSRFDTYGLS